MEMLEKVLCRERLSQLMDKTNTAFIFVHTPQGKASY